MLNEGMLVSRLLCHIRTAEIYRKIFTADKRKNGKTKANKKYAKNHLLYIFHKILLWF